LRVPLILSMVTVAVPALSKSAVVRVDASIGSLKVTV
jgi:hypothetical protein